MWLNLSMNVVCLCFFIAMNSTLLKITTFQNVGWKLQISCPFEGNDLLFWQTTTKFSKLVFLPRISWHLDIAAKFSTRKRDEEIPSQKIEKVILCFKVAQEAHTINPSKIQSIVSSAPLLQNITNDNQRKEKVGIGLRIGMLHIVAVLRAMCDIIYVLEGDQGNDSCLAFDSFHK